MRKKYLFGIMGCMALFLGACNDSEGDLLEPKVYFENKEMTIDVEDEASEMSFDLTSRLSTANSSEVNVSYTIADASVVDDYNKQYKTEYQYFNPEDVELSSATSVIPTGRLYAESVKLKIKNLDVLEEGKPFILPVRVKSSIETLPGTSMVYLFINKPVKITKAASFSSNYVHVRFPEGTFFKSFTYEALIYPTSLYDNNTVMGTEGVMIFRIGDPGGGTPAECLEAAGRQKYNTTQPLQIAHWYHVALTYDQPSGKTNIYINGEVVASSEWGIEGFAPNDDVGFNIGKIPGFPWGERPFRGYMSEVRLWSVARTRNQLQQNMLIVDPKSEGLELYYKFNGTETQENGKIQDATGKINGETGGIPITSLGTPVEIK